MTYKKNLKPSTYPAKTNQGMEEGNRSLALDILGDHLNRNDLFSYNPFYLICKDLYKKTLQSNLVSMFLSFSPYKCLATCVLKQSYLKIDSWIPYTYANKICVLGKLKCEKQDPELNNTCAIGTPASVAGYFLGLLSVGITFSSLEILPAKAFKDKGKSQYIDFGYGRKLSIRGTNIVDLRMEENNIVLTMMPFKLLKS